MNISQLKILKYWKSVSYSIIILYVSFIPSKSLTTLNVFDNTDKIVHFFLYLFFTLILIYDLKYKRLLSKITFNILLLTILFSLCTELLQKYVFTYRSGSFYDFIANIFGIFSAFVIFYIIKFIRQSHF